MQFQMAERACTCKDRVLTSSHALSYLLHLLIATALAGRIQKITMQLTHLHFLHVVVRGKLPFLLLECDFFVFLIFIVVGSNENIIIL